MTWKWPENDLKMTWKGPENDLKMSWKWPKKYKYVHNIGNGDGICNSKGDKLGVGNGNNDEGDDYNDVKDGIIINFQMLR